MFRNIKYQAIQQINVDPAKKTKAEIQRVLRKIKTKVAIQEYHRLYPTGSCPENVYGTTKINKLKLNGKVDKLPIRPILFNIGTATYNLASQ